MLAVKRTEPRTDDLLTKQRAAQRALQKVNVPLNILSLGVAVIGAVNFYYLAMKDLPSTPDNPNPPKMGDVSRWTSIIFHGLLYRNVGMDLLPALLRFPRACLNVFRPTALDNRGIVPRRPKNWVVYWLKASLPALGYYYVCSLFSSIPSISLIEASELAGTQEAWAKALLAVQLCLLFRQVDAFIRERGFDLGHFLQRISCLRRCLFSREERTLYSLIAKIEHLKAEIQVLSEMSPQDQALLLKIIAGHTSKGQVAASIAGLIQGQLAGGLGNHSDLGYSWPISPTFENAYHNFGEVLEAAQNISLNFSHLKDQNLGQSGAQKCWAFFTSVLRGIFYYGGVFLSCVLFAMPQISLSIRALGHWPNLVVRSLNPFDLPSDSWSAVFIFGLAIFFFNAVHSFLSKVVAKHLTMISSDLYGEGLTWRVWRYMQVLFSQHLLVYSSITVGALSVPPFAYIFGVGFEGLNAMSLTAIADFARNILNDIKPWHLTLTYFVATLIVASVFHHIGKNFINWLERNECFKNRDFRNAKTSCLELLDDLIRLLKEHRNGSPEAYRSKTDDKLTNQLYALSFYQGGMAMKLIAQKNKSLEEPAPSGAQA